MAWVQRKTHLCCLFHVRNIYIYFFSNEKNRVCYRKFPFDPGIQILLVDVNEALETQISGASYPNDQLAQTKFLPNHHS